MNNKKIPNNIFQTHKSSNYLIRKPKIVNAMKSWCKHKKNFNYIFFSDLNCDKFIKNNFDEKINKAYFSLPLGVMKADLWRYCVIYKYGGIYADADTVCNINPTIFINNSYLTVAPEPGHNFFCQWTFSAPKDSPILKTIIDLSVERILQLNKGDEINVHYLTGPAVFTDGIIKYLTENNLPIFHDIAQYHRYPSNQLAVFKKEYFHEIFIKHLYAGSDNDGWKKKLQI
jgi:mannosyltransferase OCH1-like enzyme